MSERADVLESIAYDDHTGASCVTIRGIDIWFKSAESRGDTLILYSDRLSNTRVAVVEDPPVDAETISEVARVVRVNGPGHIDNYEDL